MDETNIRVWVTPTHEIELGAETSAANRKPEFTITVINICIHKLSKK